MNDEQKYIFDLQGYIVLKKVMPAKVLAECNEAMDRFEAMETSDYPHPISVGGTRSAAHLALSNIVEGDPVFHQLIDLPEVLDIVKTVSGDTYRLNHTYSISRWGPGECTHLHFHGTPLVPKCQYRYHNGRMLSTLTKAVFPMFDAGVEDGCFAVIPGSHKSNFPRPWGDHPDENPVLIPVEAEAGDCIIFTEALTHGSVVKTSERPRRTLYYCYSIGWMPDWGDSLFFSDNVLDKLSEEHRDIVRLKTEYVEPEHQV